MQKLASRWLETGFKKSKNRDRLGIVAAILEEAEFGARKTNIQSSVRLTLVLLRKYLILVCDCGFVRFERKTFYLTDKGREFLEKYREFGKRYAEAQNLFEVLSIERKTFVQ